MAEKPKPNPRPKPGKNYKYTDSLNYREVPTCIYFYYLTPDETGTDYQVEVYYYDHGEKISQGDVLNSQLAMLVDNARNKWPPRQPCGWDFDDLRWRRTSYFVIAVDDNVSTLKAIEFEGNTPNHTFLDGGYSSVAGASLAWCVNYMKMDDKGKKLEAGTQHFRFRLTGVRGVQRTDWSYDGGSGTNMGPPVPPPSRRSRRRTAA